MKRQEQEKNKIIPWHAIPAQESLEKLQTTELGLSSKEAEKRLKEFGPNKLPSAKRPGIFEIIIHQFKDPLVYLMLSAGLVSLSIGHINDAIFILAILFLNSAIGTVQEWNAEINVQALQKIIEVKATVLRNKIRKTIPSHNLVPGDIILIETGQSVPADIRLIDNNQLTIDESLLTGESRSVTKSSSASIKIDATLGDRLTMLHGGTSVLKGRGIGVVCYTGDQTEIGRIAKSLTAKETISPPLILKLRRLTKRIAIAAVLIVSILGGALFLKGEEPYQIFILAVALTVAAIPEGLPVAITVALSVATRRMAKRNVIVRRLAAVEGLGSCTVIASDKTGTLTQNSLTVTQLYTPEHGIIDVSSDHIKTGKDKIQSLVLTGALCNEGQYVEQDGEIHKSGDTADIAFLNLAARMGIWQTQLQSTYPQKYNIPFESERRYAASFNQQNNQIYAHVKGATETILSMCKNIQYTELEHIMEDLAHNGFRILALASGPVMKAEENELKNLKFLGFACIIDPVRPEVPDAVNHCHSAGIKVSMITGDHPETGLAIARQLNIARTRDVAIIGTDFPKANINEPSFIQRILKAPVFARIEPLQKETIIGMFQSSGELVAVTGDGVNDAPALRKAHIGIAMGKSGTDVAREASDLILTDDNFASIVNGVEEGRIAYDNVRKVTLLLISTGVVEIMLFFLSLLFGLPLPLTAVQLLWLNIVTQGIQDVALAFEKGEPDILNKPPRDPKEPIFNKAFITQSLLTAICMGGVAFGTFYYLLEVLGWSEFEARNGLLLLMVMFENVHVFNCRSETRSAFKIPLMANPFLVFTVILAQSAHIAAMYIPGLSEVLDIEPVKLETWFSLFPLALLILVVIETYKFFLKRKGN